MIIQKLHSEARFSNDMKYRYLLWRIWDETLPRVLFIMLNPSTADAEKNDPTVKRCMDYAHLWGYGSAEVANLFALRSTNPKKLFETEDPIGPHNLCMIEAAVSRASMVVAAWGGNTVPGFYLQTVYEVLKIVTKYQALYALSKTKDGVPGHPLYLKADAKPFIYRRKKE